MGGDGHGTRPQPSIRATQLPPRGVARRSRVHTAPDCVRDHRHGR